jgi:hypothetical protein
MKSQSELDGTVGRREPFGEILWFLGTPKYSSDQILQCMTMAHMQ